MKTVTVQFDVSEAAISDYRSYGAPMAGASDDDIAEMIVHRALVTDLGPGTWKVLRSEAPELPDGYAILRSPVGVILVEPDGASRHKDAEAAVRRAVNIESACSA